ncbi:MAG: roadblock/LC7 domain-containing protein [Aquificaceae bacterium]|nr:roadblock/LC7 domain-containing protein [Aquificaceae bacterium]
MELDLVEYEIDRDIAAGLSSSIKKLSQRTQAELVVLTDDAGRIIAVDGKKPPEDFKGEFIASLISGVFGAAVEMGKILSLEDLEILQYESRNMDVIIRAIPPRFLLGVLIKKGTSLGTTRLFIKESTEELSRLLRNFKLVPVKVLKIDAKTLEERLNQILGGRK